MESELSVVASSYWRKPRAENDVHFVVVDFPTAKNAFNMVRPRRAREAAPAHAAAAQHKFQQVPILVHFPPTHGQSPAVISADQKFRVMAGPPSADELAAFVRARANVHVEVVRSPLGRILFTVTVLAVLAAVGKVALDNQEVVLALVRDRHLWRTASLVRAAPGRVHAHTRLRARAHRASTSSPSLASCL